MKDINLLPWRGALKIRQARYMVFGCLLIMVLMILVFVGLNHQTHQKLVDERLRHQRLEQEMIKKMTLYRRENQKKSDADALSMTDGHVNKPVTDEIDYPHETIQVNYAKAVDLAALLKDPSHSLLSEQGLLMADPRTNVIWVQDTQARIHRMKAMLKQFDIPSRQVLIEARLVNMSQDSAEDLGVRFGLLQSENNAQSSADSNSTASNQGRDRLSVDLAAIPLEANAASVGIAIATLSRYALLDMELSALETAGKAEIIASPKLMATNQEPAIIESGEDIPYQEVTPSGATSVSFKKAVLSLKVLPSITSEHRLMMQLSVNQNSDSGRRVQGVPIILTKSIETRVMIDDGQTIVLGGIYKQDENHQVTRVPFWGNLPILGHLFQRKQWRTRHDELLIFITPKIQSS